MPKSDETNDHCPRCGEPVSRGWPYAISQKIEEIEMTFSAPSAAECLAMAKEILRWKRVRGAGEDVAGGQRMSDTMAGMNWRSVSHVFAALPLPEYDYEGLARSHGSNVVSSAAGPGSVEGGQPGGLDYWVLPRSVIGDVAPLLHQWHLDMAKEVSRIVGRECVADQGDQGLNVNLLEPGKGYVRHRDSGGLTLVCFPAGARPDDGGELVLVYRSGAADCQLRVHPVEGLAVMIPGRWTVHEVLPTARPRISIPAVFQVSGDEEDLRWENAAAYLYAQ